MNGPTKKPSRAKRLARRAARLIDRCWPFLLAVAITGLAVLAVRSIEQGHGLRTLINQRHTDRQVQEVETKTRAHYAVVNRALNVERWCEGHGHSASLNGIVRYDRGFVKTVSAGLLRYKLSPNDCLAIIKETLIASQAPPHVTKAGTPLVYRALSEQEASEAAARLRAKVTRTKEKP